MLSAQLDHIVVTAPSLERGADWVRATLGVEPQIGGAHARMGTHNRLLRLGEAVYLEVIAIDRGAPEPGRPRWFGLDRLHSESAACLATWVARTNNIAAYPGAGVDNLGVIEPMSRGALNWLITVTADGAMPCNGLLPALIEWQTPSHPAAALPDCGLRLVELELWHPDAPRLLESLRAIGVEGPYRVSRLPVGSEPYLSAHIQTPSGVRTLGP